MIQRRISLDGVTICEVIHWASTHEKTPDGIPCNVTTSCGYSTRTINIRELRSDVPPTCFWCIARRAVTWLGP